MKKPIGLVAAGGRFPIIIAQKCRALGLPLVTVGLRGSADPSLATLSHRFYWSRLGGVGRTIRCLRREGVELFTVAGKFHKVMIYRPWLLLTYLPDLRGLLFFWRHVRRDKRDDSLMRNLLAEFARSGLTCVSALELCPELLVNPGILTKRRPTAEEEADIELGWNIAKEMGRFDIGQSVAIQDKVVLAVEAIEGTDRAILRAGELNKRGGFVVVKVAKPQQDMRFDVPTIGKGTIETIKQAGGRVLAIEAGKTIVLDVEETIRLADNYGITIVAR